MTKRKSTSRTGSSKKNSAKRSASKNNVAAPSALSATLAGAGADMNNQIQKSGKHVLAGAIFPGSVSDAHIAGAFGETFEVKPDAMKATLMSSAECLDTLAFYTLATKYFNILKESIVRPVNTAAGIVSDMVLDERISVMISSAISRMICILLRSAPHEMQKIDGKQRAVVTFEDFFSFLVKNFSSNVVLFEKGSVDVANKNIDLSKYELEVVMADINNDSTAWADTRSGAAYVVDASSVGKTFESKFANPDAFTTSAYQAVFAFLGNLDKKYKFVATSDTLNSPREAFAAVLTPIVLHVLAFTFVQPFDFMFKAFDATGEQPKTGQYDGVVYHRTMAYPSLIAVMKMYGIEEKTVDEAVHALQMRITEVRKLFQKARDAYDEKPKTMRIHESEPAPSSYLQSESERMNAQKLYNKMTHKAPNNTGITKQIGGKYGVGVPAMLRGNPVVAPTRPLRGGVVGRDAAIDGIAGTYGDLRERGIPVTAYFGRRHPRRHKRSSFGKKAKKGGKKRRSASFGKAKKGGKKRRSASFGKKRRSAGRR